MEYLTYLSASVGNGSSSAECIVAILNGVIERILDRDTLIEAVVGIRRYVVKCILYREQIVVLVVGIGRHVVLGIDGINNVTKNIKTPPCFQGRRNIFIFYFKIMCLNSIYRKCFQQVQVIHIQVFQHHTP